MKTQECKALYQAMVLNKTKYPYQIGLYKLKETLSLFKEMNDEIGRIMVYGKKGCRVHLWHCTPEDRFEYLAKLPLHIAERLGSAVYPAIDGLLGDGLTQVQVNKIKKENKSDIENLVDCCDATIHIMKRNAKSEPTLLILSAIRIVEDILYSVEMTSRADDGISFSDYLIGLEQKIEPSLHR